MKKLFTVILIITAILTINIYSDENKEDNNENFVIVPENDIEMAEAIKKAQSTVDKFIKNLNNKKENQRLFTVKIKIIENEEVEHIWITDVEYKEGKFSGKINNQPVFIKSLQYGQKIEATKKEISDWMFVENDKLVGGYTVRLLIRRMPEKQRESFLKQLSFKVYL